MATMSNMGNRPPMGSRQGTGLISRSASNVFGGSKSSGELILDEERKLIDKVFGLVDKDKSGSIDKHELKQMFQIFGIERDTQNAVDQILSSKEDADGPAEQISKAEFQAILSAKFSKDSKESEIRDVFQRMAKTTGDRSYLNAEAMMAVSKALGENADRAEIEEMLQEFAREPKKGLSFEEFLAVMHEEL